MKQSIGDIFICNGRIDQKMFTNVSNFFEKENALFSSYFMFLNSNGGEIEYAEKIAETMMKKELEKCSTISTIGGDCVDSSALVPFIAGLNRFSLERKTKFFFHRARLGDGIAKNAETEEKLWLTEKNIVEFISKKIKVNESDVWDLMNKEKTLSFYEALELRIVNGAMTQRFFDKIMMKKRFQF